MPAVKYIAGSSAAAGALGALTLYNGVSVIAAPTDVFVLLGGAWRMFLGQVPHVDYSNPIGALAYALIEAGMALGGPNAHALAWAGFLLLAATAVWASLVAYTRLEPWLACGFVVFLAIVCVATRPLGYDPANHSYAMLYNRIGWVLLSILAVQAFVPIRNGTQRGAIIDAASIGMLIALLFYAKVTYAMFGVVAFALAFALRPGLRGFPQLAALVGGLLAIGAAFWFATGVEPAAYLRDLAVAGKAQSPEARLTALMRAAKSGLIPLAGLALAWAGLIGRRILADRALRTDTVVPTLQFAFLCGAGLALTVTNASERGEVPLYAAAALILLHNRALAPDDRYRRWAIGGAGAVAAALALLIAGRDLASIADTTAQRAYRVASAPATQRMDAPPIRDFVIPHTATHATQFWRAAEAPAHINDGLALLRRRAGADSRLMVHALSDPFSFALGFTPPRGAPLWWDRNYNYNLDVHPPAEAVHAEVDLIMIPILRADDEGCCKHVVSDLDAIYGAYVRAHFVELDRSEHWLLLRRK
jgi:hypothetical protein